MLYDAIAARFSGKVGALKRSPLLTFFIFVALLTRLIFWFYTGRVWEDGLITVTAVRNVWNGFGLTHHASEPHVQCFSSPLMVLVEIAGQAFDAALLAARVTSLVASVATVCLAYQIGRSLAFHWSAQLLVLTYLSCDQLQVFFGMAGMETQLVTAIALGSVYFYITRNWRPLGVMCGLASISRPEFLIFLLPPIGIALCVYHRRAVPTVVLLAGSIAAPWYFFAALYYGSPVPNTILAKSSSLRSNIFSTPWKQVWDYTVSSWRDYAPFREFWVCFGQYPAPLPLLWLKGIVAAAAGLFLLGFLSSLYRRSGLLLAGIVALGFFAYRSGVVRNSYYMWYLPPFTALAFLVAGYGLSQLARLARIPSAILGGTLAAGYAMHLPFSMPLDRKVQRTIEIPVRERAGRILAQSMSAEDTVVLEPLGFVGWAAGNKTVFDFPGLGSKIALHAIQKRHLSNLAGLIDALQPTYAVVRPNEFADLGQQFPATAARYETTERLMAEPSLRLYYRGYEYAVIDNDLRILRRTRDFDQVIRP